MTDRDATIQAIRHGEALCARVAGPVGGEPLGRLEEQVRSLLGTPCRRFILDLTGADYLDSDGIRWLQGLQGELQASGAELGLTIRSGSRVDRTLSLLRLDVTFAITREAGDRYDEPSALAF